MADANSTTPVQRELPFRRKKKHKVFPKRRDLSGLRSHMLLALRFHETKSGRAFWWCRCDCGNELSVEAFRLTHGTAKACGCQRGARLERGEDLAGLRSGRLVARLFVGGGRKRRRRWLCDCDCGGTAIVGAAELTNGHTRSCGCLKAELCRKKAESFVTHGKWRTPEFKTWQSIKDRCHNEKGRDFQRYGAKGLRVCTRWRAAFVNFHADMGDRPSDTHSIDRLNNSRGYECGQPCCSECGPAARPPNCAWRTDKEQMRNRDCNRIVEWRGERLTLTEWAERLRIPAKRLDSRLAWGWPIEAAFTAPQGTRLADLGIARGTVDEKRVANAFAVSAVSKAVRQGRLIKPSCCTFPGCAGSDVQAHHWKGYAKEHRLDIVWLCKPHHRRAEKDPEISRAADAATRKPA